jgi:hypothetical protein
MIEAKAFRIFIRVYSLLKASDWPLTFNSLENTN